MKIIVQKPAYFVLFLAFVLLSNLTKAQVLLEIPNPSNETHDFFTGGENDNLFFRYFDINFNEFLYQYDGLDLNDINLPANTSFQDYSHTFGGKDYITAFDINFNFVLYEYDGNTSSLFPLPAGFELGNYLATVQDKFYITLFDPGFNTSLYAYDGTSLLEIPNPTGLQLLNFQADFNDKLYLTFEDPTNFTQSLYVFDGSSYSLVAGFPTDASFMFITYQSDNSLFFNIGDINFNNRLYSLENDALLEITTPPGLDFSFVLGENPDADEVYLSYFSFDTFMEEIHILDNSNSLTALSLPPGFEFPGFSNVHNGRSYFSLEDINTFDDVLFRLENGTLAPIMSPMGLSVNNYIDTIMGVPYYFLLDPNTFDRSLAIYDEASNTLNTVAGPAGSTVNFNVASVNNRILFNYIDNATFENSLWLFDGTDFMQIPNPNNQVFDNFQTEDLGNIYLRYRDPNFNGTLYKLIPNSLPTSADTSVTTYINIPYFFSPEDFFFLDNDNGDSLQSILITDIEQVGFLLWDGAHVMEGDIIPLSDLGNITFTPLADEMGAPYDVFSFRVGDGENFSQESYTMTINVLDPATSTIENELNIFTNIYPVPANNFTTIDIQADKALENVALRIFTPSGQVVYQANYAGIGNNFRQQLDLSSLPQGTYYILGKTSIGQLFKPVLVSR